MLDILICLCYRLETIYLLGFSLNFESLRVILTFSVPCISESIEIKIKLYSSLFSHFFVVPQKVL